MNLYRYPVLYDALRTPDGAAVAHLRHLWDCLLDRPVTRLMDPACGPGNWLLPFARAGLHVAGNDLSPEMVTLAGDRLALYGAEVVQGDMRDLRFRSGPFDVAMEVGGGCAHLLDDRDLAAAMRSAASHLLPGGLLIFVLMFEDPGATLSGPAVCWQKGPVAIPQPALAEASAMAERGLVLHTADPFEAEAAPPGTASMLYEVVRQDREAGVEWIRRTVHTDRVPGCPALLQDEYAVRILRPVDFHAVLAEVPELSLVYAAEHEPSLPLDLESRQLAGETLVVLRNRGGA